MELADWNYDAHIMLLNGLGNDWKMFIRLAGVEEHEINACIEDNLNVKDQAYQLLHKKLNNCSSFCWNHVKKILKLLEKDKLITKLENMLKSNGSGVEEEEDGKCLKENNRESKTLMFFIITKHIVSCWKSISRCLGLNTNRIEFMQKKYHDPCECAYQVFLELDDKNDLQWDDIESALIKSEEVSRSLLQRVIEDIKKHISSIQEKPMEKDEQGHDFLTEWNIVIISHVSFKDIEELGIQVDKHETSSGTISKKRIPFFRGANSIKALNNNQWKSECGDYIKKYYGNMNFFTFNYDTDKVPDSFKDFLEKNQPGFLIKDYSLYKHFELLGMLSSLQDRQMEVLQLIKMDHIGFEAKNKTIYFFKISNAKTVCDLKQDIDDCAVYVQMFLLLHKNELEGIIACLMSFIVIPTECEELINDITDNFCKNCKQYVITMNQFLNFDKLLSKGIKAVITKTTKENWKKLEKSFDFKNFKHRMGTIFGVMANQEGNIVPNLSGDISEQLDNVRIFLYPQQVSIGNSDDKHVLLKGGHGSGKTIMGRILLKKIISDFPNEILYYINFAASAAFTEDMQAYVKLIGCKDNVICCDRTRFQNNEHLSDIINEIKREHMPTSQIHLIFDEVSLDEFGEKDILSFCDALKQPPYQGAFCLIICQAMTKQRTLKENGVTHKSSFMDQTQKLMEQSTFREKILNECLRYTAKIDKLVEIARLMLESAVNKFSNKEIEKKETRKKYPMSRKTNEDPQKSNSKPELNSATNEVPLETDIFDDTQIPLTHFENRVFDEDPPKSNSKQGPELNSSTNEVPSETDIFDDTQIPLTQFENRVFNEDPPKSNSKQGPELISAINEVPSVFNFDADIKKVNPTHVNITNNGKIIESQFHYVKDSKVLHNIEVTELPRLYFPFDKKNSFSPFEYVYLTMLCFDHLFESRYIDSDEEIVVIHLEDQTPHVLLKALKLYEILKEGNIENIEFKSCLDVQGAEYKNVIIYFSVAEYYMRHFIIEAITRCKCNLAFFVMKENWEFAKKEVLWNIIQIWIESIDNEEKYITAFHTDDLNYADDDLTKFQALYENELDERFYESSHDKEVAAENVMKAMKNLGIAKKDTDDADESSENDDEDDGNNGGGGNGDNCSSGSDSSSDDNQNTPGSANNTEGRKTKKAIKNNEAIEKKAEKMESDDEENKANKSVVKEIKNLGIAKKDSDNDDDESSENDDEDDDNNGDDGGNGDNGDGGDNGSSSDDNQNLPGSANYREGRKTKKALKINEAIEKKADKIASDDEEKKANKSIKKHLSSHEDSSSDGETKETQSSIGKRDFPNAQPNSNSGSEIYEMYGHPCGICIIFNQNFSEKVFGLGSREGTGCDRDRLKNMFSWLKFKVKIYEDNKKDEMEKILKAEALDERNEEFKCLVVCILSHGREGAIYTADGKLIELNEILNRFNGINCKSFENKPKIFIVHACRIKMPRTDASEGDEVNTGTNDTVAINADQVLYQSTSSGSPALRHASVGSPFIQTFCEVYEERADKDSFLGLALEINSRFYRSFQDMCSMEHRFTKKLYFKPETPFNVITDSKLGLESKYIDDIIEFGPTGNVPSDVIPERFSQELHRERAIYSDDNVDDADDDDEYEMKGNSCGKCIIFNNTFVHPVLIEGDGIEQPQRYLSYREGTDVDIIRLQRVFEWLKFTVKIYTDRERSDMYQILQQEASNEENTNINCLVVCILSHGKEGGIFAADGRFIKLQNILDIFVSNQCKALLGKPKLFFVQACQEETDGKCIAFDGKEPTFDGKKPTENEEPSPAQRRRAENKINVKADQFVFLSTTPGNVLWRSKLRGSWFIQTLCKVFEDLADKKAFHELVLKINYRIAKRAEHLDDLSIASMMSPVGQNTLRKAIRFHPDQKFTTYKELIESIQAS